jgi:hypothetical protein
LKRGEYLSGLNRKFGVPIAIQLYDKSFLARDVRFSLYDMAPCHR